MSNIILEWIAADDPRMQAVHTLRHEALFAPFGVPRDDGWDDAGGDRKHLVAMLDGEVVGYTCLLLDADGRGHLRQVSVTPGLQRSGIGGALMREAEAEAVRLGLPLIWLNARASAQGFYTRHGWSPVGELFPSGRTGLPHIRMEKVPGR